MTTPRTRIIIVYAAMGLFTALAVELVIAALYAPQPQFARSLEAFDAVLPLLSMGMYWLFNREK